VSCWIICSNVSLLVFQMFIWRSACFSNFFRGELAHLVTLISRFYQLICDLFQNRSKWVFLRNPTWMFDLIGTGRGSSLWEYNYHAQEDKKQGNDGAPKPACGAMIMRLDQKDPWGLKNVFSVGWWIEARWQQRHLRLMMLSGIPGRTTLFSWRWMMNFWWNGLRRARVQNVCILL